jgi:hypothetical protein
VAIHPYDRHSTTAKGVNETVNWNMKDPKNSANETSFSTLPRSA